MRMQTVHAKYQSRRLAFAGIEPPIPEGADVMIVFSEPLADSPQKESDPVDLLRGRAKGEGLTETLLESRRDDRMKEQARAANIRL